MAPVGEARGLVEPRAGDALHQLVVGDAVAEAADHRRHLCVEHRMRHEIAEMDDDFDVLARRVKDLDHRFIGHQPEERFQVDVRRQRIDQRGHAGRRHLDQAEDRPEGRFADEFGVDGDEIRLFERGDNGLELILGGDDVHQIAFWQQVRSLSISAARRFRQAAARSCVRRSVGITVPAAPAAQTPSMCAAAR